MSTAVEVIQGRAIAHPHATAIVFLPDGETENEACSYGELDRRARSVARGLIAQRLRGERAVLLFESGIDFVMAFLGCLYAGVTAVPAVPPTRSASSTRRLTGIMEDCAAACVLMGANLPGALQDRIRTLAGERSLRVFQTDELSGANEPDRGCAKPAPDDLAYLQYTSGSTGAPKGVRVTHANLAHNEALIAEALGAARGSIFVSWLPLYHDMGLVGCLLQPLFVGGTAVLMSPASFLRRPARWLEAITRFHAQISGGPNFAYELCCRRVKEAESVALDLKSWSVAFCGSEPIQAATLRRFSLAFGARGLAETALFPCYGLAEATLFVTGAIGRSGPKTIAVARDRMEAMQAQGTAVHDKGSTTLVSSGRCLRDTVIAVVDPESAEPCIDGTIGEIWVSSGSVSSGYWGSTQESAQVFRRDAAGMCCLRTGDLGFLSDGELYITGRLKDLIILGGRNFFPNDIESALREDHPELAGAPAAVFSVPLDDQEGLIVVQELPRHLLDESLATPLLKTVRESILESFDVWAHAVVLVRPASLPKTSSGKVQRRECRRRYLESELEVVVADTARRQASETSTPPENPVEQRVTGIWADILGLDGVTLDDEFFQAGGHSLLAVRMIARAREVFGIDLSVRDIFENRTVRLLSQHIQTRLSGTPDERALPDIQPREPGAPVPLSHSQQRFWVIDQLQLARRSSILTGSIRIEGPLDTGALELALGAIVRRHASLRSNVLMVEEKLRQVAVPNPGFELLIEDLATIPEVERSARVAALGLAEANQVFDLGKDILLRARLLRFAPEDHALLLTLHHIAADGWSVSLLLRELEQLYNANVRGVPPPLADIGVEYADFAVWQRRHLNFANLGQQVEFWRRQLAGAPSKSEFPTDRRRPAMANHGCSGVAFCVPAALTQALRSLAIQERATLYMVLLACFQILLSRHSGQKDVVVGSVTAGRRHVKLERLVGCFTNTVALRADLSGDPSWREFLAQTRERVLEAQANQDLPFERVLEIVQADRDLSRHVLFQTVVAFQEGPWEPLQLSGLRTHRLSVAQSALTVDVALYVEEISSDGIKGRFEYATDLFERESIQRLIERFQVLLSSVTSNPHERVSVLPMLSSAERGKLLRDWSGAHSKRSQQICVHEQFMRHAQRAPDAIAVVHGDCHLSYGELARRSAKLACFLQANGVGPGVVAGLFVRRDLPMVVGMLGIFRAGGAYLPLDPSYPKARLESMLVATGAPVVIAERAAGEPPTFAGSRTFFIDTQWPQIDGYPDLPGASTAQLDDLGYVLFTSGSTGKPKGVMGTHRVIANRLFWEGRPGGDEIYSQNTTSGFIDALWGVCMPLVRGLRTVLVPGELRDVAQIVEYLTTHGATRILLVPSLLRAILECPRQLRSQLGRLKYWESSGEGLPEELATRFREVLPHATLNNVYGASEFWDMTSYDASVPSDRITVPIGRPIGNVNIYILDEWLDPVPMGAPGEIYASGAGLSRGYWQEAALTSRSFVPNPFGLGERLYRTGDLGRFLPDGNIEYLGRRDSQIKIRGFRIETREVEAALLTHVDVAQALVVAREDHSGTKRLVAYLVERDGSALDTAALRHHLRLRLPEYMVPAAFMLLTSMPLTPNGKVDRLALPSPDPDTRTGHSYVAPRDGIESELARIWAQLLGLERIGIHDNFFECGGDSIIGLQAVARANAAGLSLSTVDLFEEQTIARLAAITHRVREARDPGATDEVRSNPLEVLVPDSELAALALKLK